MKLLIDGDILVYTVGYCTEARWYQVTCPVTAEILSFGSKRDVRERYPELDEGCVVMQRMYEGDEVARKVVDSMLRKWQDRLDAYDMEIFLTDEDITKNFRHKIYKEYKANRKKTVKPVAYSMLRQYLQDRYGATVVSGIEADDALGIAQDKDTVIVSKDKDLLQVPGLHYDISRNVRLRSTNQGRLAVERDKANKARLRGGGFKWFCAQMILGDAVDNIKGINRKGPIATYNLLNPLKGNRECWEVVKKTYEAAGRKKDLILNANLLWILREPEGYFNEENI